MHAVSLRCMLANRPTPLLQKYINLKGLHKKNTACMNFASENLSYLGECNAKFKNQGVLFDEKNRRSKISWHCPFNKIRFGQRYLTGRLPLQGFYLWRVDSAVIYTVLWWSNLEILYVPFHPSFYFMGELSCRPFIKEHSLYTVKQKDPKNSFIIWDVCGYGMRN
jgi:hypothetical protein